MHRKPMAFMSYATLDDRNLEGWMTEFRKRLASAVSVRTGEEFEIFQDRNAVQWGQKWKERIDGSLDGSVFLVAMVTPAFFRSDCCRRELGRFLGRERELGRNDLVLPVYCVDVPVLDDQARRRQDDPLAEAVMARQLEDWRQLRFESFDSRQVLHRLDKMARRIAEVAEQLKKLLLLSLPPLPDLELCPVEGGEFLMGDDASKYMDEKPAHPVRLSSFFMGRWPVTQRLWQAVMAADPFSFKDDRRPVERVSWDDVQEFLGRLNGRVDVRDLVGRLGCAGMRLRLPTEAEWEHAARGGRWSRGFRHAGSDRLSQVGWFDGNSGYETHEVGLLLGNELGLHDMSGNVWEWCSDWKSDDYYAACLRQGLAVDPQGPAEGANRALRGGSYFNGPSGCRSVHRLSRWTGYRNEGVGFRLALSAKGPAGG